MDKRNESDMNRIFWEKKEMIGEKIRNLRSEQRRISATFLVAVILTSLLANAMLVSASAPGPFSSGCNIVLSTISENTVGTTATLTATLTNTETGTPVLNGYGLVQFLVYGPNGNIITGGQSDVDTNGKASFLYTSDQPKLDNVYASYQSTPFVFPLQGSCGSQVGHILWKLPSSIPEFPTVALPIIAVIGLMVLFQRRRANK